MSVIYNTAKRFEKWCRLAILIQEGGESVCKDILHKRIGVPTEGQDIYNYLQHYKTEIKNLNLQRYQEKILLPDNGVIDKRKLDLPLCTYIIQILDQTKQYLSIKKLRYKRNEIFNMEEYKKDMCEEKFEEYWNQLSELLKGLNYDMNLSINLKSEDLFLSRGREETIRYIVCDIQGTI